MHGCWIRVTEKLADNEETGEGLISNYIDVTVLIHVIRHALTIVRKCSVR